MILKIPRVRDEIIWKYWNPKGYLNERIWKISFQKPRMVKWEKEKRKKERRHVATKICMPKVVMHHSNQIQPQLLSFGSNPEGTVSYLGPDLLEWMAFSSATWSACAPFIGQIKSDSITQQVSVISFWEPYVLLLK